MVHPRRHHPPQGHGSTSRRDPSTPDVSATSPALTEADNNLIERVTWDAFGITRFRDVPFRALL